MRPIIARVAKRSGSSSRRDFRTTRTADPKNTFVDVLPDHRVVFTRNILKRRAVEDLDVTLQAMARSIPNIHNVRA